MKSKIRHIIPEEELDARLQYWQERLNLNHWDIKVRLEKLGQMGTGKVGRNNYAWTHHESRIALIHPDDFEDWGEYDMEFILVHELLHLIIDVQHPIMKGRKETFSEQAINSVAATLVQMDRELTLKKNKKKKGK